MPGRGQASLCGALPWILASTESVRGSTWKAPRVTGEWWRACDVSPLLLAAESEGRRGIEPRRDANRPIRRTPRRRAFREPRGERLVFTETRSGRVMDITRHRLP